MLPTTGCDGLGILLALMATIGPLIGAWWLLSSTERTRKTSRPLRTKR